MNPMPAAICPYCLVRPATVHLSIIDDGGHVQAIHICQNCSAQHHLNPTADSTALAQWITDHPPQTAKHGAPFPSLHINLQIAHHRETGSDRCQHCGITWKEFMTKQRLGCAHDYSVFADRLIDVLEQIHGARSHEGRRPGQTAADDRRSRLLTQLEHAIEREHYEEAAQLRDRLRQLDQESGVHRRSDA
jgi:protein arginine kinase activator